MYPSAPAAVRSVSDGESDGERRNRRSRRKRGGGRIRPASPEISDDERVSKRKRSHYVDRCGMAPPNSTQFLLDDREKRADVELENDKKFEAAERRRVRTMSGSYDHMRPSYWCTIEPATTTTRTTSESTDSKTDVDPNNEVTVAESSSSSCCGSTSAEEERDDEEARMDREFETDYMEVKRERIQSMTRSQLAAELLERDEDTQLLTRELGSKESENRHLRQLLSAHGISPDEPVTSTTGSIGSHVAAVSQSKSPVTAN